MAKKSTDEAKKKNKKPKVIAAVVLVLVGYKFFLAPKPAAKAENAPKKEGSVVALPELTLNLYDDSARYLRVGIAVVYWEGGGGAAGAGHGESGDDKDAQIASAVAVDVLSHKRYAELKTHEGKEEAKKNIAEELNHELHDSVARVLFTSFVMQ